MKIKWGFYAAFGSILCALALTGASFPNVDEAVLDDPAIRCSKPATDEPIITTGDFKWGYGLEEMRAKFTEMYRSPKRLQHRAYYDPAKHAFVMPGQVPETGVVVVPERLIASVRAHIEQALRFGYVDAVFFPDMGHTHLFIELSKWESDYSKMPTAQLNEFYSRVFADPDLKMLYHTAEQLSFLNAKNEPLMDRELLWRMNTRNLVGDNRGQGRLELLHNFASKANTAHDYPGHYYYGAGFNLSANERGCFPYVHDGKTYYFDLSMHDLPSAQSSNNFFSDFPFRSPHRD